MSFSPPRLPIFRAAKAMCTFQKHSARCYATDQPQPRQNKTIWLVTSAGLGFLAAYYLLNNRKPARPGIATPSEIDQPATRKAPAGENTMSSKQEGIGNADTSNPYLNSQSLSEKGERETDSAKVKGTISPSRPQV